MKAEVKAGLRVRRRPGVRQKQEATTLRLPDPELFFSFTLPSLNLFRNGSSSQQDIGCPCPAVINSRA